jgi:hypothetical protein
MRLDPAHLDHARKVADAILYEGYLLYPYRRSSQKNQIRFQFGVLMPPAYSAIDDCEPSASQTECLVECPDDAEVRILIRFLQLQRRIVYGVSPDSGEMHKVGTLYVDGSEFTTWDEAAEREQHVTASVAALLTEDRNVEFHAGSGEAVEDLTDSVGKKAGRLVRQWDDTGGMIRLHAERVAGPYQALRLRVRVENHVTPGTALRSREDGLRHSLIAAHLLIGVPGGTFLSMTDSPQWATEEIAGCVNVGTWPVLAGPEGCTELMLSSPVILYDHPEIAPESAGDLFDATEIDEILTLRTMALTDAEKREARATDPRAAELLDRMDHIPPEMLERMHGAIRYLRPVAGQTPGQPAADSMPAWPGPDGEPPWPGADGVSGWPATADGIPTWPPGAMAALPVPEPTAEITDRPSVPWWDPGADASVSPDTDHVVVAGVRIASGSRVVMRPGIRRADAQDLFLIGREATVQAVLHDVDGEVHIAVSPDNDPAAELQRNHGRFLYFSPDEVEPIDPAGPTLHPAESGRAAVHHGSEEETK